MPIHVSLLREGPLTADVSADVDFPKMNRLEMPAHVVDPSKHLVTGVIVARHSLGSLDTISWRILLLAALGNMGVVVFFRRKGGATS